PSDQLARRPKALRGGTLAGGYRPQQRESEHEKLVEGEAFPPHFGLWTRAGPVDRAQCVRAQRHALGSQQRRRQLLAHGTDVAERLCVQVSEFLLCDVFRGGINGCEITRLGVSVEVVRADSEPVPVRATSDAYRRAADELRLEPRLVEPRRPDLTG